MYNPDRFLTIKPNELTPNEVIYFCINTFRYNDNHGLLKSIEYSEKHNLKLTVVMYHIVEDNARNNDYFLKGIQNYRKVYSDYQTILIESLEELGQLIKPKQYIIIDQPYLKEEKKILAFIKSHNKSVDNRIELVESNVLVPVKVATTKETYSARTIRSRIWTHAANFMDSNHLTEEMFIGEQNALETLNQFRNESLDYYHLKNDPSTTYTSKLSVSLKYGFISPVRILKEIMSLHHHNSDSFIEELIVRRELAYNFIYYNEQYDDFNHITYEWAYQTMLAHQYDHREYLYVIDDYIHFKTHDPYFNTAMKEMVYNGYMHGYMRMYWAKKVIEWSASYEEAYKTLIYLNNYYFLDGNTPNGYTGVAWCFGKHDRAWKERLIFGKIRYINSNGLKRKFDIEGYVKRIQEEVDDYE